MNVFSVIRKGLSKLFGKAKIGSTFGIDIAISSRMETAMKLWAEMYEDDPPWKNEKEGRFTTNTPVALAAEVSRLVTIEMKSTVAGSPRADFINEQYQPVIDKVRNFTEYACAKGGIVLKPFISGEGEKAKVGVTVVQPEDFYPVDFDSDGDVTSAVFTEYRYIGSKKYTRLEYHKLDGTRLTITNKAFCIYVSELSDTTDDALGNEVSLAEVPEWANIAPSIEIADVEHALFAYFRMPFANHVEPRSPLGVSIYSRAIDQIKKVDRQWSEILWEYEGGELAVHAPTKLFARTRYGMPILPAGKERLYRTLESDKMEKADVFNPAFRDSSLFNGLNKMLMRVEFLCGLAYGTISDPPDIEKTATEIQHSKQRSYSTVSDIQKALQKALEHLVYSIDTLATLYELAPEGKYEVTFEFDDSIIVDAEAERLRDQQEVAAGLMKKWEFRVKWYGETEQKAKEMVGEEDEQTDDEILKLIQTQADMNAKNAPGNNENGGEEADEGEK